MISIIKIPKSIRNIESNHLTFHLVDDNYIILDGETYASLLPYTKTIKSQVITSGAVPISELADYNNLVAEFTNEGMHPVAEQLLRILAIPTRFTKSAHTPLSPIEKLQFGAYICSYVPIEEIVTKELKQVPFSILTILNTKQQDLQDHYDRLLNVIPVEQTSKSAEYDELAQKIKEVENTNTRMQLVLDKFSDTYSSLLQIMANEAKERGVVSERVEQLASTVKDMNMELEKFSIPVGLALATGVQLPSAVQQPAPPVQKTPILTLDNLPAPPKKSNKLHPSGSTQIETPEEAEQVDQIFADVMEPIKERYGTTSPSVIGEVVDKQRESECSENIPVSPLVSGQNTVLNDGSTMVSDEQLKITLDSITVNPSVITPSMSDNDLNRLKSYFMLLDRKDVVIKSDTLVFPDDMNYTGSFVDEEDFRFFLRSNVMRGVGDLKQEMTEEEYWAKENDKKLNRAPDSKSTEVDSETSGGDEEDEFMSEIEDFMSEIEGRDL